MQSVPVILLPLCSLAKIIFTALSYSASSSLFRTPPLPPPPVADARARPLGSPRLLQQGRHPQHVSALSARVPREPGLLPGGTGLLATRQHMLSHICIIRCCHCAYSKRSCFFSDICGFPICLVLNLRSLSMRGFLHRYHTFSYSL